MSLYIRWIILYYLVFLLISWNYAYAQSKDSLQFRTGTKVLIEDMRFYDNEITKQYVLENEFLFKKGDTLQYCDFKKKLQQSKLNLTNTSLFNFIVIDTILTPLNDSLKSATVHVRVIERWYIWPVPILETTDRNFNAWLKTMDYTRIYYGLDLQWYNLTGRQDDLGLMLCFGKKQIFNLSYNDLHINGKKHLIASISGGYTKNREVGVNTLNNKLQYINSKEYLSTQKTFSTNFTYKHNLFVSQGITLSYDNYIFADSVFNANPDFSYKKDVKFLSLSYVLRFDYRDVKYYPLHGWYSDVGITKQGLGFDFENPVNVGTLKTTNRYFWQLAKKWYAATSLVAKLSTSSYQPYFFMRGLGYSQDYVRGYESYVIDGKYYAYSRSSIKYELLPKHVFDLKFINIPKFTKIHYSIYLNAFFDMGYVARPENKSLHNNNLTNTLLLGGGLGIDIVTYYDKIIRVEYSINKMGKTNFSFHFVTGI